MVNFCVVFGCSNRSNREGDKGYFRIPTIVTRSNAEKQSFKHRTSNIEQRGSPRSEGKILGKTLANFTEFAETTLYQVCINTVYYSPKGIIIAFGDFEPSFHWV